MYRVTPVAALVGAPSDDALAFLLHSYRRPHLERRHFRSRYL